MREPDLHDDGWCLDDAEARHRRTPDSFRLPHAERREGLRPGDLAKLIFCISTGSDDEPVAIERMWVLVRGKVGEQYLGVLDNDPSSIAENDEFWSGVELPFSARHVIDIERADDATRKKAAEPPVRVWQPADY